MVVDSKRKTILENNFLFEISVPSVKLIEICKSNV